MSQSLPLFPLSTVLFPGGLLPLRIFEARYLDMVSRCMREDSPFLVSLITSGEETGLAATAEPVGVRVRIVDWESLPGDLLGVTIMADVKVNILSTDVQNDQLVLAEYEVLKGEEDFALPSENSVMADLLRRILKEIPLPYSEDRVHFSSANWVSNRLTELLPFPHSMKQAQLVESDPEVRLDVLKSQLYDLDLIG